MNPALHRPARPLSFTSRPYDSGHDFDDLKQMQGLLMEARSRSNDWRYWHIGELNFQFFLVACHLDPQQHIRLWRHQGKLAGYAILSEDPSYDWQVLPEYEWRGIEDEAIAWAEALLATLRKHYLQQWGGTITAGARQDDTARIAFLERHGFRRGEYAEVNTLRSLDVTIPEPTIPAGCQVRPLSAADAISNRAEAQRDVWRPWGCGNISDEQYERMMRLPGYQRDLDVVAVAPDGVIASYVNGWIDPLNRIGDFGPVGAREGYRRKGLTRAVLLACLKRMKAWGMERVCVSTGVNNTPARRLYESVGFRDVNMYLEYVK